MSGHPSPLKSADAAASVQRVLPTHLVGHILEFAVTQIVEEEIFSTVGGELEAVVHDLRRGEMPQIDIASEVRRDVEVEQTVAIVIEPDRAVAIHPSMQPGFFGHVLEMMAVQILV